MLLAFGVVWGGLSLIFLLLGIRSIQSERQYGTEGATAPGVITAKWVAEKRGLDRETKRETISKTYYLQYQFTASEGRRVSAETSVSKERWDSAREQEAVRVQYLRHDAVRNRLAGEAGTTRAWILAGLGAVGVLIGLGAIVAGVGRKRAGVAARA
ncbi:MAG: DUF3592 domain-containing protein [Verrucomicrobiaceae bacterium]|nr:DUF3592 domain-containing protein [Verrucomicrobiaceae bacterium]